MSAVLDYKRKVYAIRDLPTLPVIAQKVLMLADDDEASAEKLTTMIASDQESIGTLAGGVAHDFNNILGIILPNAEMIKMKIDPESAAVRYADVIINSSRRAGQLTRQLLSLSRKDPVSLRVISLNDAAR